MTRTFKPGEKVFVKSSTYCTDDDNMAFVGKVAEVDRYDAFDDTYRLRIPGIAHLAEWFSPADIISLEEHRAEQIEKVLKFFGSGSDLNYAAQDNKAITIDGTYSLNALITLLQDL